MCSIFDYYYNISGAPKKNIKKKGNNKTFNNNEQPVFETLDSVANYKMSIEKTSKDLKVLKYYRYGTGVSLRMHVFIPSVPTVSTYPNDDWIPYYLLSTHFFRPKNITNPWANTHNTLRFNYIGFYRLHNNFINLYCDFYGNLFATNRNSNNTKLINSIVKHLMCNVSFCTHGNVSIYGKDSVNILDNFMFTDNGRVFPFTMNYKNNEGIITAIINNSYFSASLGCGLCYTLPDILRYVYNIINYPVNIITDNFKTQNKTTTQQDFVNAVKTFFSNLALRDVNVVCGTEFTGSFRPYFLFNHTVYKGNTSSKDTFFAFYYGLQLRFNRVLCEFKWELGFLNVSHFVIKSLNNAPDLERKIPTPRISQGNIEFVNTVPVMEFTIYWLNSVQC